MAIRRKTGNGGNGYRTNRTNRSNPGRGLRMNQAGATDPRLVGDLLDDVSSLKAKNRKLESQLDDAEDTIDAVSDVLACTDPECSAEDHLDEIRNLVDGGDGNGEDDDYK